MIPAQPTKSSRRSSILKIPKSRSSLTQGGDSNASTTDDSPTVTTKLKRRVSFAEKKHVKEFCDSIEQGTVWDNTYEESDLSQMKTNQSDKFTEVSQLSNTNGYKVQISSNVEVHSSITVTNKSFPLSIPKLVRQNAVDYESYPFGIMNDSSKIRQSTILNSSDFLINKENIPEILKLSTADSSLVEDEEIVACPQRSLNASPYPKFSVYCDDETEKNNVDHLNCSNYENVSMECTILAGNSSSPECNNVDKYKSEHCKNNAFGNNGDLEKTTMHTEKTQMFHDKSMEITEAVPNTRFSLKPSAINEEKTQFFHNASMEITEAIPSVKCMVESNRVNDEATQYFQNKSMQMTEVISQMKYPLSSSYLDNDKTKIFHNKSMEITEALSNVKSLHIQPNRLQMDKIEIFPDNSMEMKEAFSNVQCSTVSNALNNEKTTVFHNNSMEMTEAVSNMKFPTVSNTLNSEKTTVFHNNSMEMTEAVLNTKFSAVPNCFTLGSTQVIHDDSLEMTGVFPFVKFPLPKPSAVNDERTTVFHDKSMEMTEAVSNMKCFINSKYKDEEKTQFFHDKSMEITKPVSYIKSLSSCSDSRNKTRVFHNQSMEMTEAITPLKFTMNKINENSIPTLPKNTTNIDCSTNLTPHDEIDHNNFMEFTEAIQSIKRPYNLIGNADKSLSELLTPIVKNPRYSTIPEQNKTISEENLQKLHRLLHQDFNKINSLSQTELLQDNNYTSATNVISNRQLTSDDNDPTNMTEVIPPIQQKKVYGDEIQNADCISPVKTQNPVEQVNPINSNLVAQIEEPNESLNNEDNLLTFKENDLLKENQSSAITKSLQLTHENTTKQSKVIESTSSNLSCNNTLEVPNLLEVFNTVVKETPIMLKQQDVSFEKSRFQSKFANNAQIEDDITYDLTRPIGQQHKEIEKTFLEFEEAPSFMYDQNLSDQYSKKEEGNELFDEPPVPELSMTEVFTSINTNSLQKKQITHTLPEQEISNIHEKKDDIEKINCKVLDEKKEEKINRRATFVVKKHDNFTDIVRSTTYSEVESTEKRTINQFNGDNEVLDTTNKVNAVTTLDRKEYEKIGNKMDDCEITKEQSICRPSIQINLLNADNESHVNDNQLISVNTVSKKREDEHVKDVINKLKKHEDKSVISENDTIIKTIVQTAKEFADLKNRMKYMVKLGMSTTNKTEEEKSFKNADELITDTNNDKSPYEILNEGLRMYEKIDECIWKIYDINPKIICIEYYKTALRLLIKLNVPDTSDEYEQITNVRIISRLNDEERAIFKIIDNLIIQRINTQSLVEEYKTYEDIPKVIQRVTNEIKVIYDFYDDFEKLNRKYVIDILDDNRISFVLRSQHMNTIIRLSIKLNFFTKIHPEDFKSISLLGSNIQNHVEKLAKSTKPGSNFLSTYIKQVEQLLNVY